MENMKKQIKQFLITLGLLLIIILPHYALAGGSTAALEQLRQIQPESGYAQADSHSIVAILGVVINGFFALLGMIFIILTIYAGFTWMTAGGDEQKVTKARSTIQRAVIGLLITVCSAAIWTFIFGFLDPMN